MYAVVETGGKQYRVEQNDVIKVEKLAGQAGEVIKLDRVLALGTDVGVTIGAPVVEEATVSAEVLEQKKDVKVIIFKKKRRHNYRRKNGHRQQVTMLRILDVSGKGEVIKLVPKKVEAAEVKSEAPKVETKAKEAKKAAPVKTEAKKTAPAKEEVKKAPVKKAETSENKTVATDSTAKKTTKKED